MALNLPIPESFSFKSFKDFSVFSAKENNIDWNSSVGCALTNLLIVTNLGSGLSFSFFFDFCFESSPLERPSLFFFVFFETGVFVEVSNHTLRLEVDMVADGSADSDDHVVQTLVIGFQCVMSLSLKKSLGWLKKIFYFMILLNGEERSRM